MLNVYSIRVESDSGKMGEILGNDDIRPSDDRCSKHVSILWVVAHHGLQRLMPRDHGVVEALPRILEGLVDYGRVNVGSIRLDVTCSFIEYLFAPANLKDLGFGNA